MSNFHGRLMNIPSPATESSRLPGYYEGHRDARHAAAEIGLEADALAARLAEAEALLVRTQPYLNDHARTLFADRREAIETLWRDILTYFAASEQEKTPEAQAPGVNQCPHDWQWNEFAMAQRCLLCGELWQ